MKQETAHTLTIAHRAIRHLLHIVDILTFAALGGELNSEQRDLLASQVAKTCVELRADVDELEKKLR